MTKRCRRTEGCRKGGWIGDRSRRTLDRKDAGQKDAGLKNSVHKDAGGCSAGQEDVG